MNPSTTALTLNMQLPNIAAVAWAVQGDQLSRFVECTLVDGSTAWNPQTGYHGVIRAHKPDGTSCVYDVDEDGNPAVTWTGNVATVTIAQQAVTVAGTVLMQLEFYDTNNARITAFGWAMNVQPSAVTDTEFLSADYYNILTLQIAAVLGSSGHPPYIDPTTKNWMIWDVGVGGYVDSGYSSVGMTGPAPVVTNTAYQYANSNSGTVVPSSWSDTRPATQPGTWDWTKTVITFDNNTTTTLYNSAYQGNDGQGSPGSQLPLMDGTASVGTASAYSREDHVHPVYNQIVRPNLLDNWYFVGGGSQQGGGQFPINQRGQTSYSGANYTIDRWTGASSMQCAVYNDYIRLSISSASNSGFIQVMDDSINGKRITLSFIYRASISGTFRVMMPGGLTDITESANDWTLFTETKTASPSSYSVWSNKIMQIFQLRNDNSTSDYVDIMAVKLEIGETQTLAHQENGAWVLNEIPNYQQELAKCQRYFQTFRTQSLRPTYGADFRPVMATATPSLDTLTIDGITYYTALSDL